MTDILRITGLLSNVLNVSIPCLSLIFRIMRLFNASPFCLNFIFNRMRLLSNLMNSCNRWLENLYDM